MRTSEREHARQGPALPHPVPSGALEKPPQLATGSPLAGRSKVCLVCHGRQVLSTVWPSHGEVHLALVRLLVTGQWALCSRFGLCTAYRGVQDVCSQLADARAGIDAGGGPRRLQNLSRGHGAPLLGRRWLLRGVKRLSSLEKLERQEQAPGPAGP